MARETGTVPALVTGATGFIGCHLVRALLGRGRDVIALARNPKSLAGLASPRLRIFEGGLQDAESVFRSTSGNLTVFHLAAIRGRSGDSPDRLRETNVAASCALARSALVSRVKRFIYVSSALVFGPAAGGCRTEKDALFQNATPRGYLSTRVEAMQRMRELAAQGLPIVTLFPAIVFGPDEIGHRNQLTNEIRRRLRTRLSLLVEGGRKRRNLVFVDDVVKGIILAEELGRLGDGYILGGEDCSHFEFNQLVFALSGRAPLLSLSIPAVTARRVAILMDKIRGYSRPSGYENAIEVLCEEWRFSSRKAQEELGYETQPLREGIRKTLRFLEQERR